MKRVKKILHDAVLATPNVLVEPPPDIYMETVDNGTISYLLEVVIDDYGARFAAVEALWERLLVHLHGAGIHLAGDPVSEDEQSQLFRFVERVEIFKPLTASIKTRLADGARQHRAAPGEVVMAEGDPGDSLYIVAEGCVAVMVAGEDGRKVQVARLGVGETLGGLALLTGRPRMATVTALTETRLYEITKAQMVPILEQETDVAGHFAKVLDRQLEETEHLLQAHQPAAEPQKKLRERLIGEIHKFFRKE